MKRIYLDNAATTQCHPAVVLAMQPYFAEKYGNPSSLHFFGQETRAAVESAREKLAKLIGALPEEIVFTSGGTEADNFAIHGVLSANSKKGNHIITSAIEHHAILEPCEYLKKNGYDITILPVDKFGLVDPQDVAKAITDKTVLVSIMHANNEMGTIEPISEISKITKEKGVYLHTDAVQTVGEIEVNVKDLGVDLLSLSGHKFYGPKGVGVLYIRKGTRIAPFIRGGAQERNRRASTENVPGIVGMGVAAELSLKELTTRKEHTEKLQKKLIKGIFDNIPEVILNGHPEKRLAKNVNISFRYIEGESILLNLDMEGVAASTGSACSSGTLEPSHVLLAIGLSHEISHGSIRFSIGQYNSDEEIDYLLDILPKIIQKLRSMSPLYKKS